MKKRIKRWWFKQKIKHDLRVEYSNCRDKSRLKKDLDGWMKRYDERAIEHKPTYHDDTILYYYGRNLFWLIILLIWVILWMQ